MGGQHGNILRTIVCDDGMDGRSKVEDVAGSGLFPEQEAGNDGRASAQGDARQAAGGAGWNAEKRNEDAFGGRHVRVHEDADAAPLMHGVQQAPGKVVARNDPVAVATADGADKSVEAGIVQWTRDQAHGMTLERVIEAGQLPGAEMTGEDKNAFAAGMGLLKVLQPFVANPVGGIFQRVVRHLAEFGEMPANMGIKLAKDALVLGWAKLRQSQGQIAKADLPQTGVETEKQLAKGCAQVTSQPTRHQADKEDEAADRKILDEAANGRLRHNR